MLRPLAPWGIGFVRRGLQAVVALAAVVVVPLSGACSSSAPVAAEATPLISTVVTYTSTPAPSSTSIPPSPTSTTTVQPVARVIFNIEVTPTPIPGATFTATPEPTATAAPTVLAPTPEPSSFIPTRTPFVTFKGTPQPTRTPFATPSLITQAPVSVSPTITPVVTAVETPAVPLVVQSVTPTAPTFTPTAEVAPVPSPVPGQPIRVGDFDAAPLVSTDRYGEFVGYMLHRINTAREEAGVGPVSLAHNAAAQIHAEGMLENCVVSHWSEDGLKPYMRYALLGDYQENEENAAGSNFCVGAGYEPVVNVEVEIDIVMAGWVNSPGHRRNLLNPVHRKVSVGLAWDAYNFFAVQHFEGDYITFSNPPHINAEGVMSLSGVVRNGIIFASADDLAVQVYYDQAPHGLTRGQLSRTLCYDFGLTVAALRPPPPGGYEYAEDSYEHSYRTCDDPYDVPANVRAPATVEEGDDIYRQLYSAVDNRPWITDRVPLLTALTWTAQGQDFALEVDMREILNRHGLGVYSLMLAGRFDGAFSGIARYPVYYGIPQPVR